MALFLVLIDKERPYQMCNTHTAQHLAGLGSLGRTILRSRYTNSFGLPTYPIFAVTVSWLGDQDAVVQVRLFFSIDERGPLGVVPILSWELTSIRARFNAFERNMGDGSVAICLGCNISVD